MLNKTLNFGQLLLNKRLEITNDVWKCDMYIKNSGFGDSATTGDRRVSLRSMLVMRRNKLNNDKSF